MAEDAPPPKKRPKRDSTERDDSQPSSSAPETTPPGDELLTPNDVSNVLEEILEAQNQSKFLGLKLNIPDYIVTGIHTQYNDPKERLYYVLVEFLKQVEPRPTWRAIAEALKSPTVNLPQLAMKVKAAHFPDPTASCNTPTEMPLPHISEIVSGPQCISPHKFFATAVHKGMAYFANLYGIHKFDVHKNKWIDKIPSPQACFGMAVIENELIVAGGMLVSEESEENVDTKKVACWPLFDSSKQKSWDDKKYPAMDTTQICPQVVAAGKYLIALGGCANIKNGVICNPTMSVEILDLEEKQWYSNDRISLPEVFTTMMWQSACICNDDLFIAVEHDDPNYSDVMENLIEIESTDSHGDHNPELDEKLPNPYPCFSLYCCSVETLVHMAKNKCNDGYCWQERSHPHPSVYKNPFNIPPIVLRMPPPEMDYEEDDLEHYHQTDFFHYGKCCFTLSCIKSNTLIAVGCEHVKSNAKRDIRSSLYSAYVSNRAITRIEECFQDDMHIVDERRSIEKCYIHCYDIKKDSWQCIGCTPDNGSHDFEPSVAVVDDKIVILGYSMTMHVCTMN